MPARIKAEGGTEWTHPISIKFEGRSVRNLVLSIATLLFLSTASFAQLVDTPLGPIVDTFGIEAIGIHCGQEELVDVELDEFGYPVRQAKVVVNIPDKPVVLVLTAFFPTVWRIGATKDTEIAGVMVSGNYGQAVIGLDAGIPLEISTHAQKGSFEPFVAYKADRRLLDMIAMLKKSYGRKVDNFYGSHRQTDGVFYLGERPDKDDILFFDAYSIADYNLQGVDREKPIAGLAAVIALVEENKLRLATQEDIDGWIEKASEELNDIAPELRIESRMRVGKTYVVLDEVELPNGLRGCESLSFIIPDGVPMPTGPKGDNSFYLMDGTEAGPHLREW